jgi:predicted HicB family RNase H-like nuclease
MAEEIEIDIDNCDLFNLMLEAHKQDITLNALIVRILGEAVEKEANGDN